MNDVARVGLLIVLGAALLTIATLAVRALRQPERRVRRALLRAVGSKGDGEIIAGESGAAFSLARGVLAVAWEAGRWRMAYPLEEVLGGEILVDSEVAARVFRGEARRPLDKIERDAETVSLRLMFADPRQPDFEMSLWPSRRGGGKDAENAAGAIREANSWLARTEALLRQPIAEAPLIRAEPVSFRRDATE
jgi:hypothetical protein